MMKMIGARVLVTPVDIVKEIDGIALPDDAQKQQKFKVVDVGPDVIEELVEGDIVLIGEYTGTEIVKEGVTYRIVEEEEILAKVEE